jgi:hypothetical protein
LPGWFRGRKGENKGGPGKCVPGDKSREKSTPISPAQYVEIIWNKKNSQIAGPRLHLMHQTG